MLNGEMIFHWKRHWEGCVITSESLAWYQCQAWKNFLCVSITHHTSFWGTQNIVHENDCVAIL